MILEPEQFTPVSYGSRDKGERGGLNTGAAILSHVQTKVRTAGSREGKTEQIHQEKKRCQGKVSAKSEIHQETE